MRIGTSLSSRLCHHYFYGIVAVFLQLCRHLHIKNSCDGSETRKSKQQLASQTKHDRNFEPTSHFFSVERFFLIGLTMRSSI